MHECSRRNGDKMGDMAKCRLPKRKKKKAVKKFLTGRPLAKKELQFIRQEIGPVRVKGLMAHSRGMVIIAPHEAKRILELGKEMKEALTRAKQFEQD